MNTDLIRKIACFFFFLISFQLLAVPASTDLDLSDVEQEWLSNHSTVSFTGDPNWLPYEAFDEQGNYIGIVAEHLALISKATGLAFQMSPSKTWTESTEKARQGQVDILSETDDSDLISHLNFTKAYISNPIVIAMHNRENYVEGIGAIENKKIALIKNYGYASKIRRGYSNIEFVTVDNIQSGLVAVATGKVDALLCTLALCSYTISELNLNNVRIVGKTEFDTRLALGVQKHLPELLSILNKGISSITREEQQRILDGWIKGKFVEKTDYTLAYQILGVSLLVFALFAWWNRRLSREITLRIHTEDRRSKAEKTLRAQATIIDQIHDAVIATDMNGIITSWNSGAKRLLGYTKVEMLGQHLLSIYPEDSRRFMENDFLPTLKYQGSHEGEVTLLKKSGDTFYAHLSMSMLYDEVDKPMGMISYSMDVNERKNAEVEVERLASIVKASPEFIGIADMEGNVVFVNEAGKDLVKLDEAFPGTTPILDFFPEDKREFSAGIIETVIEKGLWSGEMLFRNFKTDEKIPVWCDALRIDHPETGLPMSIATVSRDIREQKRIDSELSKHRENLEELVHERTLDFALARDEAERANVAKSEFLSRMSHELRTPLNAILGFGQLLEMDDDQLNETQQGNVAEIIDAGDHLLELIDELLDLATIESGKLQVDMEEVNVDEALLQCLNLIEPEVLKKGLQLIDNVSGNAWIVQANFKRLKQVLLNLLSNAVKYNSEHGSITLDYEIIRNKWLRISVTDSGMGLSDAEMAKLFTSFERMGDKHQVEGTGIGLVITKHLVEQMLGDLGVSSTKGKGSTFWVEFALVNGAS